MRFGLQIPNFTTDETPGALFEGVAAMATAAEEAGYDSVWVMDHFYQLPPMGGPSQPMLDAYTLLGALATQTSRVRLGTMVTGVTYRNPAHLAKIVTTLDVISAGRAILGIGAAWYDVEHEGLGFDFPPAGERLDRLEEALQICRAMFTEEAPTFDGRYYRIHEARNMPPPVQPGGPRILIGGGRREADTQTGGAIRRHDELLRRRCHRGAQGRGPARPLRGRRPRPVRGDREPAEHPGAHRQRGRDSVDARLPAPGHRGGAHHLGHRDARRAGRPHGGAGGGGRPVLHLQHADRLARHRAAGGRVAGRPLRRAEFGPLLGAQQLRGRRARRQASGDGGHQDRQCEGKGPDDGDRSARDRRGRHRADLAGEEVPEHPAHCDADGDADDAPDHGGDARLYGDRDGELAPGEAECLEDGQVVAPAPDRRHKREAERGRGTDGQCGAQQERRRAEGPVVDDLRGTEHPEHGAPVDCDVDLAADGLQRCQCGGAGPPFVRTRMAFGPGVTSKRFRAAAGMIL